jgi:hypothetical protein
MSSYGSYGVLILMMMQKVLMTTMMMLETVLILMMARMDELRMDEYHIICAFR